MNIRKLLDPEDMRACEDLQIEVWGYSERDLVPKNELIAAVRSGGSLLGAFDGTTLVGFAYGMAGFDKEGPYLSSRLLAIKDAYRSQGLGEKLKLAQREDALAIGYSRIRWTQDPLQAANARLNFAKLGATSRSYVRDYYGSTSSPLHGSVPTDRLELVWDLRAEKPRPVEGPGESLLDVVGGRPSELRPVGGRKLTIAIPPAFSELLKKDAELALAWRLAARAAFEKAFAAGLAVMGFEATPGASARYVLT